MKSLLQYDWPGNVRELENCVERAVALGDRQTIDVSDLPPAIRAEQSGASSSIVPDAAALSTTALAEMERMTILRVFEQANGDKALTGKMLGHQPRHPLSKAEAVQHSGKERRWDPGSRRKKRRAIVLSSGGHGGFGASSDRQKMSTPRHSVAGASFALRRKRFSLRRVNLTPSLERF